MEIILVDLTGKLVEEFKSVFMCWFRGASVGIGIGWTLQTEGSWFLGYITMLLEGGVENTCYHIYMGLNLRSIQLKQEPLDSSTSPKECGLWLKQSIKWYIMVRASSIDLAKLTRPEITRPKWCYPKPEIRQPDSDSNPNGPDPILSWLEWWPDPILTQPDSHPTPFSPKLKWPEFDPYLISYLYPKG